MDKNLTDEQIARLFALCGEVTAVYRSMPAPPAGHDTHLETARGLRASLSQHDAALTELGQLLSLPVDGSDFSKAFNG